jgi:hypothetical protein
MAARMVRQLSDTKLVTKRRHLLLEIVRLSGRLVA